MLLLSVIQAETRRLVGRSLGVSASGLCVDNENLNGFIRRFIPKGSDIQNYSKDFIRKVEEHINHYPRRTLNGFSSAIAFDLALQNLSLLSPPRGCHLT